MSNNLISIDQLVDALQIASGGNGLQTGRKHTPAVVGSVAPYAHGTGGLFSTPGQDRRVFSAMLQPSPNLANRIPVMPPGTAIDDPRVGGFDAPLFTTIQGVTQGDAEVLSNQRNNPCATPPEGGLLKAGTLTAQYGRFSVATRQYDIRQNFRAVNYAEPYDLQNMNTQMQQFAMTQPGSAVSGGNGIMNNELMKRVFEAGVSLQRWIAERIWVGDPANNTAGGGYREFEGLEILVNEGNKVDALTGTPLPSMNSYLLDFDFNIVNGTGRDIVEYIQHAYYRMKWRASQMQFGTCSWVLAMRPELFDEITKVWPVRYYQEALNQMAAYDNGRVNLTGTETTELRDRMRNEGFLPIRGDRVPVILDDAIPEDSLENAGEAEVGGSWYSDIYLLPMTVLNSVPVLYWEAFRYSNARIAAERINPNEVTHWWVTDDGIWLWNEKESGGCRILSFECEPRIILRTPQLAARIQNVGYQPLDHLRTAYPAGAGSIGDYFVDGGRTNAPFTKLYTQSSSTTPVTIPTERG